MNLQRALRVLTVGGALALAVLPTLHAQPQTRDQRPITAAPKGTGEINVQVVTDETNSQPIRRVSVAIQAGEIDVPHIGVTDDNGRVVFNGLAAGNYLLTATRAGYVKTFYGSAFPGRGPGVSVTVSDTQRSSNVQIRMLRGAVITGTIRGVNGRPMPNQQVQATMVRSSGDGNRRAVNLENGLGIVSTDDRGVFRVFGLAPGEYIVFVPALSVLTEEVRPMTAAEVRWADGVAGTGVTSAPPSGVPVAPESAPPVVYAPVYYPGTAQVSEARVITLGPTEERPGIDISLMLVPTAKLTGRVVDADGRPQSSVRVELRPTKPDGMDLFSALFNVNGYTDTEGAFTINAVKPGSYTMTAKATPKSPDPPAPGEAANQSRGTTHFASEELTVQGADIPNITLMLRPGMTVSGQIVYQVATKTPPADLTKTQIALLPAPTGTGLDDLTSMMMGLMGGGVTPRIDKDGKFTFAGVPPGRYRLNTPFGMITILPMANMLSGGWTLKSVMLGGRDIADAPIEIRSGVDVPGVVVTFTDQPSELSGSVTDASGRPTTGFPIIVFSTDRQYWTLGSRRVQTARPGTDGKYKVTGLPAGEYFVCAVTAVDRSEVYDPAFLEQLVPLAFKITMADGEKKVQDLRLGGK
jgi:protocatechuate 3,4-dioxygenase beta subunit